MPYQFVKHAADLKMEISGNTPENLFEEALRGMMEVLSPKKAGFTKGEAIKHTVSIKSGDLATLLIDFLNKVLALSQITRVIYTKVTFRKFSETELVAELEGFYVEIFAEDIKAAAYRGAKVEQNEKGRWETNILFDI